MRNQYSSKVLKSGCILSDLVTLYQLRNHEFTGTQEGHYCRNARRFCLRFKSCETQRFVRELVVLTMSCRKCTMQMFTSSQFLFFVWEKSGMILPEVHRKMEEHHEYCEDTARRIGGNHIPIIPRLKPFWLKVKSRLGLSCDGGHLTQVLNGIARSMAPGLKKALSFQAVRLASKERVQQRSPLRLRAVDGGSVEGSVLKIVSQVEASGELSSRSSTSSLRCSRSGLSKCPRSRCLLGPEQTTQPAPTLQRLGKLLVELCLLGSHSTVPRQDQKSKGVLLKPDLLGPEQMTRNIERRRYNSGKNCW